MFWVGPGLEPWRERPLTILATGARVMRLADTPGLTRLALREGAVFEAHDHGLGPDHGEDETDPHFWLDPMNANLWLGAIAAALAEAEQAVRLAPSDPVCQRALANVRAVAGRGR